MESGRLLRWSSGKNLIVHQGKVVSSKAVLKSTTRFHRTHAEIKNSAGKINSRCSQGN